MENNILLSILLVIVGLIIGAGIVFIINLIKKQLKMTIQIIVMKSYTKNY